VSTNVYCTACIFSACMVKRESLDLYGGRMDVGCYWLGVNQYLITLYITIFMLKLENFYDHEYNTSKLLTSLTLSRYLRSKQRIFTLETEDFTLEPEVLNNISYAIFSACSMKRDCLDLWCS
jgi:hypothetical protein